MMQSVSLSALKASTTNPRRKLDRAAIEGLAASIKTDGVLQNLVVSPVNGDEDEPHYRIVSGSRRFAALCLLQERGELPEGFAVPVEIRGELSRDDHLRIATVENLQRQNLAPLEETAALTKLVHKGVALADVVAQTGLSAGTIKRRLALNGLCKEAKKELSNGEITLSQAEALTLGDADAQLGILERLLDGSEYSAADIKGFLLDERPSVALAIFPLEQYGGTITTDLFAEAESSYFDDAEAFFALQRAGVAALAEQHEQSAAWVEVTEEYRIPDWRYQKARKNQKSGVLINLSPSGRVEIREGLAKPRIERETIQAIVEVPTAPKPKAEYSAPLCRYIAQYKSAAVAEVLIAASRKAREVMAVHQLEGFTPHEAFRELAKAAEPQTAYTVLEAQARLYASKLGFEIEEGESVWSAFPPRGTSDVELYSAVKELTDPALEGLITLLTALRFGQETCERLDTDDSLFNRVARDLAVDMKNHWRPDRAFLERRNREQLLAIAQESGCARRYGMSALRTYKKSELVEALQRRFDPAEQHKEAQAARDWLPGAMHFPAIERDAVQAYQIEISDEAGPHAEAA